MKATARLARRSVCWRYRGTMEATADSIIKSCNEVETVNNLLFGRQTKF